MLINTSRLGHTGTQDWLLLRASAIIISLYTFYIVSFIVTTSDLNYIAWCTFFTFLITKIFTILTLISILIHAWIGIWQVLTDYVKSIALLLSLQLFFIVILMSYLIYGTIVMWRA